MKRMKLLLTLAIPVLFAQNIEAQQSRLIGAATWTNNGAMFKLSDSSSYTYSGNRGGDLMHTMMYDAANTYTWNDSAYLNSTMVVNTYDSLNNMLTSTTSNWDTATASWVLISKTLYFSTGTTLNSSIYQIYSGGWVNVSENLYAYNSSNQMTQQSTLNWNSLTSSFDPSTASVYSYDGSGNMTSQVDYTYSTVTLGYVETDQYNYTYNAGNQMLTEMYSLYSTSALSTTPSYMYTNSYDTAGDMLTTLYQTYNASTAAFVNISLNIFGNFTAQMPQMEIEQNWDTVGGGKFDTVMMFNNSYNSFNQLTTSIGISWHVGGFWEFQPGNPEYNYYYETYNLGVKNVAQANGNVSVFPIPAQNVMNISVNWNMPQTSTVVIYDIKGSIIRQWSTPESTQYSTTIPVNNIAAGTYMVAVTGADGTRIVKQISVVH